VVLFQFKCQLDLGFSNFAKPRGFTVTGHFCFIVIGTLTVDFKAVYPEKTNAR